MLANWYVVTLPYGEEYVFHEADVGHIPLDSYNRSEGPWATPVELVPYMDDPTISEIEKVEGYGARMSEGEFDSSDWAVFETRKEAWGHLERNFGVEEPRDFK